MGKKLSDRQRRERGRQVKAKRQARRDRDEELMRAAAAPGRRFVWFGRLK